jgi:hypothetical protein
MSRPYRGSNSKTQTRLLKLACSRTQQDQAVQQAAFCRRPQVTADTSCSHVLHALQVQSTDKFASKQQSPPGSTASVNNLTRLPKATSQGKQCSWLASSCFYCGPVTIAVCTMFQECTNLQILVKCLDLRGVGSDTVCSQARLC